MKKKIFITLMLSLVLCCLLAVGIGAKEAYVEKVPSHLVDAGESLEYFIVLDGEEYYGASQSTLDSINTANVEAAISALAEKGDYADAKTGLGTKYMIKFVFPEAVNGTAISHVYMNNNAFKGDNYFRNYCAAIVYSPEHKSTGDANDRCGNIRSIDFGENSKIKQIPLCYMQKAYNLRELKNFPMQLDSIEESAFAYCGKLCGTLYINATTVKKKAFDNAIVNIDGIILGKDTVNIYTEAFSTCENREGSKHIKFIEFQCDVTKMNIVDSASNQGAFYFASGSQRNQYSSLTCLVLSHPNNQAMITEGTTTFQDFLPNVYFNEASKNGGNLVIKGHNDISTLSYKSFLEEGTKASVCQDCGYVNEGVKVSPLFVCLGYSSAETGKSGVIIGFKVNRMALSDYETATNTRLSFGVFAASESKIGNNDVISSDGTVAQGVIAADLSANTYDVFQLKIYGFTTDAQKSAKLAMGAYVIEVGETESTVSYLQAESPLENNLYSFISYNEITAE